MFINVTVNLTARSNFAVNNPDAMLPWFCGAVVIITVQLHYITPPEGGL